MYKCKWKNITLCFPAFKENLKYQLSFKEGEKLYQKHLPFAVHANIYCYHGEICPQHPIENYSNKREKILRKEKNFTASVSEL